MKKKSYKSFEELDCWKACRDVRKFIYELVKKFPSDEKYGLVQDMRRAARSTTHNIAEGFGRFHYQENIQFCRQSRGSLYELIDHFDVAVECEYLDDDEAEKQIQEIKIAIRVLNGYIKYLKNRKEIDK